MTVGGQKHYVHPQPTAGASLTFHPDDQILALFWSEGDTLHLGGRLSCGWVDLASLPCHRGRPSVQLICAPI
jgi:hypothetical protein